MGEQLVIGLRICRAYCDWSFLRATRVCPIFASWRDVWLRRCEAAGVHGVEQFADAAFLQLLFTPHDRRNSISLMSAHLSFAAAVCQAQRSLLEAVGNSSQASCLSRNSAMDDSIGDS
ncbi:unnamed protein product [Symbiodinium natans]|uniref:Uncharacterized protein n=1 Tax=Symbiodinium natans TaxID=878477 RepID=A0A812PPE4_9DINO|nr:unnamed protein product [Symbiodinium natans]